MSRSLVEHWAAAPTNMSTAIELMVRLAGADHDQREAALARLSDPVVRQRVRDRLPPPGLAAAALHVEQIALIVERLKGHGADEWLAAVRGRLWFDPLDTGRKP